MAYKQSEYYKKLLDPRWQKLRLEVLSKSDFTCDICMNGEDTLHVHHNEYFKGREPWEYEISQLSVLCESCHEHHHTNIDSLKLVNSYLKLDGPASRDECAILLAGFSGIDYYVFIELTGINKSLYTKKIYDFGKEASKGVL